MTIHTVAIFSTENNIWRITSKQLENYNFSDLEIELSNKSYEWLCLEDHEEINSINCYQGDELENDEEETVAIIIKEFLETENVFVEVIFEYI